MSKLEKIILKTYNNAFGGNPLNQITAINDVQVNKKIKSVDIMNITIDKDITWLKRGQRVELYEIINAQDILLFDWYIDKLQPSFEDVTLVCKSNKWLMKKKLVLSNKNYVNEPFNNILNDLLNDWFVAYWENWTFNNSLIWNITKEFKEWDSLYWVIDEMVSLLWWVWTVKWTIITSSTLLWIDRTTWGDFQELIYNALDTNDNNISNVTTEDYSSISNIVIWRAWWTRVIKQDAGSILLNWALAEFEDFREWDLDAQTQALLDEKKQVQKMYNVELAPLSWFKWSIWDKIVLRIENINEYFDIVSDAIINTENIVFENWTKIVNIGVSNIYVFIDNFDEKWNKNIRDINLLKVN